MFDLKVAIDQWLGVLNAQPNFLNRDLEELEDHLREEVEVLEANRLSVEEAFLIASHRLGNPEDLNSEFAIADPGRPRRTRLGWMLAGALTLVVLNEGSNLLINLSIGTLTRFNGVSLFPQGPVGLGWFAVMLKLAMFALGGVMIWRNMEKGRLAQGLISIRGRTFATGGILLLVLMVSGVASHSFLFAYSGLAKAEVSSIFMIYTTFKLIMMVIFPGMLLMGLWRLIRA